MNEYYDFQLPRFNEQYGEDWDSFNTIMQDNYDLSFEKIWELYHLIDINKMTSQVVRLWLDVLKIPYSETDTLQTMKLKLRIFVDRQKNKGLEDIYLDIGEEITGVRGDLYSGTNFGVRRWGYNIWPNDETVTPPDGLMRWDNGRWEVDRWHNTEIPYDALYARWSQDSPQFIIYFNVKTTDSTELDQIQDILRNDNIKPVFYRIYLIDDTFTVYRTI